MTKLTRPRRRTPRLKSRRNYKQYLELASKLKIARLEAGLSQEKSAKELGRVQRAISHMETGHQRVDIVELAEIAKVYEKPITYFFSSFCDGVAESKPNTASYEKKYQEFVRKLQLARLDASLTQVEAAKCLHQSQKFISYIENGRRRVDVVELQHIAEVYGKPMTYFDPSRPPKPLR